MKAIPQDQQQREKILSSLDRNVVIIAGAGAGKTTAIISRMIALVTRGMATPTHLAAITFTRKAAGELRNRFIEALHLAVASEDDADKQKALRTSLENSDQAFTGTIHSFCGQLLRERSFAVGLQPDFVEIDDREERILRQRYWNEYLHSKELEDDPALRSVQSLKLGDGHKPEQSFNFSIRLQPDSI